MVAHLVSVVNKTGVWRDNGDNISCLARAKDKLATGAGGGMTR